LDEKAAGRRRVTSSTVYIAYNLERRKNLRLYRSSSVTFKNVHRRDAMLNF